MGTNQVQIFEYFAILGLADLREKGKSGGKPFAIREHRDSAPQKRWILNISYNDPILRTRHAILEQAGYGVVSALGFAEALELFTKSKRTFDLVILGPSLPQKDKAALIPAARDLCKCPVLSLRRPNSEPHPDADYSVDSGEGPEVLLATLEEIFKSPVN